MLRNRLRNAYCACALNWTVCIYRLANSSDEGPSSVNEGSSSSTRSVFDALKAPALSDLTRKRSVHCNLLSIEALIDSRTLKKRCALVARTGIQQTQEL